MAYLALVLKIMLCVAGFITAFLGVFKRTIDEQKHLTGYGKICVVCVFITFCIGVSNELLNLHKESRSSADKRAADDRVIVMQVKLDRALDDGRKRGEEAKAYMLEAAEAKEKIAAIQEKLVGIDARVSDPTTVRTINEVKRLAGDDLALAGMKFTIMDKILVDIHDDLGNVRMLSSEIINSIIGVKNESNVIKSNTDIIKLDVAQIKNAIHQPDAGFDANFWNYFLDSEQLDAGL